MSSILSPNSPVGLIAGNGALPILLARAIRERESRGVVAVAHSGESDPELARWVDDIHWVKLGQFKRIIDYLRKQGARDLVMAGGITKSAMWRVRPDALALRMAARLLNHHDDRLLRAVAAELEGQGFYLHPVSRFAPELLAPEGVLSRRQPTALEWEDIHIGWRTAKTLGKLDVGQGVVVREKVVVAVEAIEGTDAMIQRAGAFTSGRGVLVKVCKPMQDHRLDLPTVGPRTLENCAKAGIAVLALEAGGTMILELEKTLALAERLNLVLVSCLSTAMDAEDDLSGRGE